MTYLTLDELKKHLNIDSDFTDDDAYITALGTAAEGATSIFIDAPLSEFEDENHKIPESLKQAMMLLVGGWYAVREAISATTMTEVPMGYDFLCALHRDYKIN